VARTRKLTEHYRQALRERGVETHEIHRSAGDHEKRDKLRIATMHRVKGLEFRNVIIAGVQQGQVPLSPRTTPADETAKVAHLAGERRLLYVAATRARDELVITGYGKPSELLQG
jgi:superfamily I DNA/RNA helicase